MATSKSKNASAKSLPLATAGERDSIDAGLPEIRAAEFLSNSGGTLPMQEFRRLGTMRTALQINEALKWGTSSRVD